MKEREKKGKTKYQSKAFLQYQMSQDCFNTYVSISCQSSVMVKQINCYIWKRKTSYSPERKYHDFFRIGRNNIQNKSYEFYDVINYRQSSQIKSGAMVQIPWDNILYIFIHYQLQMSVSVNVFQIGHDLCDHLNVWLKRKQYATDFPLRVYNSIKGANRTVFTRTELSALFIEE